MGYSTDFTGELSFTKELTVPQANFLQKMCGEDCRNHPEWDAGQLTHMDLELNEDWTGILWNGCEKTYDLAEKVNLIITTMRQKWPDFGLTGSMRAQGEDPDDRWNLVIGADGFATKQDITVIESGTRVCCPKCDYSFIIGEQ